MAPPLQLKGLSTREAVIDGIYRCINGFDHPDKDMFNSSLTHDAVFDLRGTVLEGIDAIHAGVYDRVAALETTHFLTNFRVDVEDGDKEATVSCHALSQHYRAGEGDTAGSDYYMAGSLYDVNLVKDEQDGLWKWKYWKLRIIWTQGDVAVVAP